MAHPSRAIADAKRYNSRLLLKSQLRSGGSEVPQDRPSAVAILNVSRATKICEHGAHEPVTTRALLDTCLGLRADSGIWQLSLPGIRQEAARGGDPTTD